jgi:hypothetical protein
MKHLLASFASILFLSACQTPLVAKRDFSYEGKFEVNGEQHEFNIHYSCHYEDVSWISTRGPSWGNRAGSGSVKAVGKLTDGSRFEVLPLRPWTGYGETCANQTEAVTARLFIELPNGRVESFDKPNSHSETRRVSSLQSRFAFNGSALAVYEPQEKWDRNHRSETHASVRYYTVRVIEYGNNNWSDRLGASTKEFIETRKIPLLEAGKVFTWSNDDIQIARKYRVPLRWPIAQLTLAPSAGPNETWSESKSTGAIQWVIEPKPTNDAEKWRGATMDKFKRWIEYRGSRIEMPLIDNYRLLYDKERDRIVQFRLERVDLW